MSRSPRDLLRHLALGGGRLGLPAIAVLLTACQGPTLPVALPIAPTFRMQAASDGEVGTRVGTTGIPAAATAPAASAGGTLVVDFAAFLAGLQPRAARRVLVADAAVDRVTIRIVGPGVDRVETIARADLDAGVASHTFAGLPAVAVTITLRAFDAADRMLGEDVRQSTVSANQATTVQTGFLVDHPGVATPPGGSGGSGGGANGPRGAGFAADVTIVDGLAPRTPQVADARFTNRHGTDVLALRRTTDGSVWVVIGPDGGTENDGAAHLLQVRPDGAVVEHPEIASARAPFASDETRPWTITQSAADGHVHVASEDFSLMSTFEYDAAGAFVAERYFEARTEAFALNGAGRAVFASDTGASELRELGADGVETRLFVLTDQDLVHQILAAADGSYWIYGDRVGWDPAAEAPVFMETSIRRYAADGTVLATIPLPNRAKTQMALDAAGNLWYVAADGGGVRKASSVGAELASAATGAPANRLVVDAAGDVWAYLGADRTSGGMVQGRGGGLGNLVTRVAPDGAVRAHYHLGIGADVVDLEVAPSGRLWVGTGLSGLLEFAVDVPFAP